MSYTIISAGEVQVDPGELAVRIDNDIVAVRCDRKRVDAGVSYHARARAITADGTPVLDATGKPIETQLKHTAPAGIVAELTDAAIARECMLAVLGEPVTFTPPWADTLLTSANIRVSIATGQIVGPADAAAIL